MRRIHTMPLLLAVGGFLGMAHAGVIYDISMNTAPLAGHAAGPFALEFQLNDGSGSSDGNNTALLSNFVFHGGGAVGSPNFNGGATGGLTSAVTLTDNSFFNQFVQGFTPGSALGFRLTLSTNLDNGGTPDEFTFAILDQSGTELPTLAPAFFDVFIQIDIDSADPFVGTFGTDTTRNPAGGGSPIDIAAPNATQVGTVPEPTAILMMVCGLVALFGWKHHRRQNVEATVKARRP